MAPKVRKKTIAQTLMFEVQECFFTFFIVVSLHSRSVSFEPEMRNGDSDMSIYAESLNCR
jgi:hypothetical protein